MTQSATNHSELTVDSLEVTTKIEKIEKELKNNRSKVENLLKRRFFYAPAFEIYRGVAGLYDFGPMGCAVEQNVLQTWRQMFIIQDEMLEVRCTQLTPHVVLKSSGHVDRFADLMVKDVKTGECFRVDHLIKNFIEFQRSSSQKAKISPKLDERYSEILQQLDNMSGEELGEVIKEIGCKSQTTGNELSEPTMFNLMFQTNIGPTNGSPGFLRPETAQGIFLNFKRLYEFNNSSLPFAAAQIGCSFRNEISPRTGLLRVREFMMAEIEHFVDPDDKDCTKFPSVAAEEIYLWSAERQLSTDPEQAKPIKLSLQSAIDQAVIKNTTVGYYIGKIAMFMKTIGIDADNCMRFRQHLPKEMAHYACDCWDCELLTSYGWVECVGCADRSCYDLYQHSEGSGEKLFATKRLNEPISVEKYEIKLDKSKLGKEFKSKASKIFETVAKMSNAEIMVANSSLESNGSFQLKLSNESESDVNFTITKDMVVSIGKEIQKIHVNEFQPHVIEPSFGIGRIMYSLFEHTFRIRARDEKQQWFDFPARVAPMKCVILPLSKNEVFEAYIRTIAEKLGKAGVAYRVDDNSGSIGRRYARNDELGIPFAITIDFDTVQLSEHSVTVRDRNSCSQVRLSIDNAVTSVKSLTENETDWAELVDKYGAFTGQMTTNILDEPN